MEAEIPYNLSRRLVAVVAMAMVVALVVSSILFHPFLIAALIVSPIIWLGISICLRKRPRWAYLTAGALSPLVGAPLVAGLTEEFTDGKTSPFGLADEGFNDLIGGFLFGLAYTPWFTLLTFPIGIFMGYIAYQFMRKDVWL